ncbi:hypothetical protein HZ993_17180 [Rhodoferax sp. AJA081-3]|uniref:hypothetical protein n=1 Tax=Rhodoferax sp. AJA081-3 TaxID=2752316 RepID=UPI001ADFAE6E|nr:hypothetical protein [Rhodoferax sp. AJA081-3]QTN27025.1 hypothetical protein HZ993_17180 [Rhodoferax sp. AJA081-3]
MTKREWQLAIPLLISFALCLAAFVHGQRLEDPGNGITALRVFKTVQGGEHVAVIANKALHVLDAAGQRIVRQELQTLGLTEAPNDMDWTVDAQQRVEAWFFDDTVPRVLRCIWSPEQLRLQDCRNAMTGPQLKTNPRSLAVHLAVDAIGQRVFIADAKSGRVQVFDLAGKALTSTDPQTLPLAFPNRLRYLGDDTLAVADNDNRRLIWLRVTPGQPPKLLRSLYSADHGKARAGRGKVTDVAFGPDGTVWMLAVKQRQRDGDVLVFDAQRLPVARAGLAEDSDPLFIDTLGDSALVADYTRITINRIDTQGRDLGTFGGAAFQAELAPLQAKARTGALWRTGAMVGGGVVIVVGLLLGWRFGQKPKLPGQFDNQAKLALAALGGVGTTLEFPVVLQQTAAYRKAIRKQVLLFVLLPFLLAVSATTALAGLWLTPGNLESVLRNWKLLFVAMLGIAASCASAWFAWRDLLRTSELRVTEHRVGWFRSNQVVCAAPLNEVHASSNALLLGAKVIRFRTLGRTAAVGEPMFDMDLLNRAVLSRLPPDHLVDDQALAWLAFKNKPLVQKVLLAGLFAAILLLVVLPTIR